jgi:hypothetical protein
MLQQMCGDVVKECGTSGENQNLAHGVHSARQKRTDVEMMLALVIPAWGDWRAALVGGSYAEEISTGTVGKARRGHHRHPPTMMLQKASFSFFSEKTSWPHSLLN